MVKEVKLTLLSTSLPLKSVTPSEIARLVIAVFIKQASPLAK